MIKSASTILINLERSMFEFEDIIKSTNIYLAAKDKNLPAKF